MMSRMDINVCSTTVFYAKRTEEMKKGNQARRRKVMGQAMDTLF